jgi:glycosyltransferase involved in cell wall biosynthesis
MRITVAICTWNRCELLRQTLEQMTRLLVPAGLEWELLVINNGCSDSTGRVIHSFEPRLPIHEVFESNAGLSNARNRALEEARGDYILWTDDDVLVDEGWLKAFAETARRFPEGAVFGGPIEPWFPVPPDPVLLASFPLLRIGFNGLNHGDVERALEPDRYVWGANMAFRRAAIAGLRFDPELGVRQALMMVGEEKDFIERMRQRGGTAIWSPAMRVRHYVDVSRMTRRYLTRYYTGRGQTCIREGGIPGGARLFGVPRWIWRKCLESGAQHLLYALVTNRIRSLAALREYAYWRGAIQACRLLHREADGRSAQPSDPPQPVRARNQ